MWLNSVLFTEFKNPQLIGDCATVKEPKFFNTLTKKHNKGKLTLALEYLTSPSLYQLVECKQS